MIAFDVYGTLLDIELNEDRPTAYAFLSQWLACQGILVEPQLLHERYKAECHKAILAVAQEPPDIDIGRVFSAILAEAGGPSWQGQQDLVEQFAILFRMTTTVRLQTCPGVKPLLEALSAKTRLGIISNAQRLFTIPELKQFGLLHYFQTIVFSSDVQARKPNRCIFDAFLQAAGISRSELIFIGDSLHDDIEGAKNAGIKAIWVTRGDTQTPPSNFVLPDLQIAGLEDERLILDLV